MTLTAYIEGIGLLGPGLNGWPSGQAVLSEHLPYQPYPTILPSPTILPAAERRRSGAIVKLTLATGLEAIRSQRAPDYQATVVVEPSAYAASAYVKSMPVKHTDEVQETTVLDTLGYANFARQTAVIPEKKKRIPGDRTTTEPEMPAIMLQPPAVAPVAPPPRPPPLPKGAATPRITAQKIDEDWSSQDLKFPGGVLPPRTRQQEELGPTHREVRAVERAWVMPAQSARPSAERIRSEAKGAQEPKTLPPEVTLPHLAHKAEDDFSDVRPDTTPPHFRRPVLTAAPVKKAGAALPIDPPRPSVPPMGYAVAPSIEAPQLPPELEVPPEMKLSYGAAPVIAQLAPVAPPELAAASIVIDEPAPSAPLARRMPSAAAAVVVPSGSPTEWTLAQARAALKISSHERDKLVSVALEPRCRYEKRVKVGPAEGAASDFRHRQIHHQIPVPGGIEANDSSTGPLRIPHATLGVHARAIRHTRFVREICKDPHAVDCTRVLIVVVSADCPLEGVGEVHSGAVR